MPRVTTSSSISSIMIYVHVYENEGALDGGPPMSHVDSKKWQYHMSLSLNFSDVTC